jgi:hypothetical protein
MAAFSDDAYRIKSILNLLQVNNDGDDLAAADQLYQQLMGALTKHLEEHGGSATGKLRLNFTFAVDAKGVDVAVEPAIVAVPKRPKTKMRYFASDAGTGLTLKNPNAGTLFAGDDLGRKRRGDAV